MNYLCFKKYNRKLVEKVGGMWVLLLYISFIIKGKGKRVSGT